MSRYGKPIIYLFGLLILGSGVLSLIMRAELAYAVSEIPISFRFERTLKTGARGEDVRYLQMLLNRDEETRVNIPGLPGGAGNETNFFGGATHRAVINFQNKYASEILHPSRLAKGTGIVGSFTRAKLNAFLETSIIQPLSIESIPLAAAEPISASPHTEATLTLATIAPKLSFDELNLQTRAALVNILCTTKRGGSFNPITGSGIIIDPRGIILTNAHIGQYFLLKDYLTKDFIDCAIRTGEPARNRYRANLLYISPSWVETNAKKINESEPTGTGENDFALLLITDTANPGLPLPSFFPFISMDVSNESLRNQTEVLAAAYPAGFLSGITIQKDLYPSSSVVQTGTVYSFKERTPDIFSIGGSVLAQQGSSGGAVVNRNGKLIGLIVTSSNAKMTGDRDLNALTMSHINDSFKKHTGDSIASLFTGDARMSSESFNENVAPALKKLLADELTK